MVRLIFGEEDVCLVLGVKSGIVGPNSSISPFYHTVTITWEGVHN